MGLKRAELKGAMAAALIGALVLLPLVPLVLWSVAAKWFPPDLLPQEWGLRGYRALLGGGSTRVLWDSVSVAAAVTGLAVLLAYPAGRSLGLSRHRAKQVVQAALLLPALLPSMATALGLHVRFIHLGLADTRTGVILAHLVPALPYAVIAMAAGFARYDARFEEAARNLGAGRGRVLLTVTLPNVAPTVITAGLFAFLISWSQYTLTLVVGGGIVVTLPILLYSTVSGGDLHLTAAACIVFIAPVLLLLPLTSRALSGTSMGGES